MRLDESLLSLLFAGSSVRSKRASRLNLFHQECSGMSSQKDFTVAIVGGGMVGLICAIGLARAGVQVDVFEAAVCAHWQPLALVGYERLIKLAVPE